MDNEIAALIKEMEKEEEFDDLVTEVTVPFEVPTVDSDAEEIVEIAIPEEELMEDDVLIENPYELEIKTYNIGDAVMLSANAINISGAAIPDRYKQTKVYVRTIKNEHYGFSINKTGRTSGFLVHPKYLTPYTEEKTNTPEFDSYLIAIDVDALEIKSRPIQTSSTLKIAHKNDLYTIIDEKNNWGHLKFGGWIPLDKTRIVIPIKI